jgi:hypothetical protein
LSVQVLNPADDDLDVVEEIEEVPLHWSRLPVQEKRVDLLGVGSEEREEEEVWMILL